MVDEIVCRVYTPDPAGDVVTVPLLPQSLRQQALKNSHDIPSAGHQGVDKTLYRLHHEAYWVNMAGDVERYCRQCTLSSVALWLVIVCGCPSLRLGNLTLNGKEAGK